MGLSLENIWLVVVVPVALHATTAACSSNTQPMPAPAAPSSADPDGGDTTDPDAAPQTPASWTSGQGGKLGATMQSISSGGVSRRFAVHTPTGYDGTQGVPLIVHFHGWRPLPAGVDKEVQFVYAQVADDNGFMVVAPEGLECPELNPGGPAYACFQEPRDTKFIDDLLGYIGQGYNVDRDRLYLSGHSGGGFFVQGYSLHNPTRFAATAIYEGGCISNSDNYGNSCSVYQSEMINAKRKIPFFDIHYPEDQVVQVQMGRDFMALLKKNGYPYSTLPNYDHHDGGTTGHSIDPSEVPTVWSYLSNSSLGQ
jgi:predicted esterase